jgi:hypothetical protein
MKPPYYEKNTGWLNEAEDVFWSALNAKFRQFEETLVALNQLEPSDAAPVFRPLLFNLCKLVVDEASKRLKSSKGGAEGAKARKRDADTRNAKARLMIAAKVVKLEKLPLNDRKQTKRGIALELQRGLKPRLSLSTIERLIDGDGRIAFLLKGRRASQKGGDCK